MSGTVAGTATRKVVVCGGNGFLGSRICKSAVARGWEVTSISRSGEPTWSSVTSSPDPPPWSTSVSWRKGDLLKPSSYRADLRDADAVVHSMGILLEADYKAVVRGQESIIGRLRRAFSPTTQTGSANPLERKAGEDLGPQEPDRPLTYESINRDSAIALAREAVDQKIGTLVYISAAAGAPILPARYITTKRDAESTIASSFPGLRSIFVRPGFLYDRSRSFTLPIAALGAVGATVNHLVGGRLTWLMGAAGTKPLQADVVGEAVVEALDHPSLHGPVDVAQMEELANRAWRRTML